MMSTDYHDVVNGEQRIVSKIDKIDVVGRTANIISFFGAFFIFDRL